MLQSPYCFPDREAKSQYRDIVNNIEDEEVRLTLKLILCSGFRINEVLNSYLYKDINNIIYARAPASKTKDFQITKQISNEYRSNCARFIGVKNLNSLLTYKNVWKSVPLKNIFELDILEFQPLVSDDIYKPKVYFAKYINIKLYNTLYIKLKKSIDDIQVKYKGGKYEHAVSIYAKPSFHFFRKLFVSELNLQNQYNFVKTVDYMKWSNLNMILKYAKDY